MKNILVTGGAGFIGSNLTLALQEKHPDASIVVMEDFRSGDFRNLQGFRGDIVTADASRLDWTSQFRDRRFEAIFHEASITDTTVHDQFLQTHDNVEAFRRLLRFAESTRTPIVYASSAATYGIAGEIMREDQAPAPANVYAFTKVQLDNLAREYSEANPGWKIVGLKYFNVYGPREAHKNKAASMIFQLYNQMKTGKAPRVFRAGEHKRDFVYVKDVVALTIQALEAPASGLYNGGCGTACSFNEVIARINECLGTSLEPDYFDCPYDFYQPHTEADMAKPLKDLGFNPGFPPDRGIADYLQLLEKHGARAS